MLRPAPARATIVACIALLSFACGKDPLAPPPEDIVGTWIATKITFVSKDGLGSAEVVSLGWGATLVLNADRTGVFTMNPKDHDSWSWPGAWEIDGDLFRIAGQGADIRMDKGILYLDGFDGVYDFTGDDVPDRSKFDLVLNR